MNRLSERFGHKLMTIASIEIYTSALKREITDYFDYVSIHSLHN